MDDLKWYHTIHSDVIFRGVCLDFIQTDDRPGSRYVGPFRTKEDAIKDAKKRIKTYESDIKYAKEVLKNLAIKF